MYWPLLFWLLLLLPGFALLRAVWRDALTAPGPVVISLSFLATLGLLSPLSIAFYAAGAPLALFSIAIVGLVIGSIVEITRRGWWRDALPGLRSLVAVEAVLLLIELVMSARVGGWIVGDASVHLSRARFLLDHGFNNMDPWVGEGTFFPIYHTNLLHALVAAAAQITRVELLVCWQMLLPVAKLLITCGIFHMTWAILRREWPAWAAALFFVTTQGPVQFLVYPNKLAPFWLIPTLIALVVPLVFERSNRGTVRAIVIGMLVLAQIHMLYALFATLLLGPAILFAMVRGCLRERGEWPAAALLAFALFIPAPFALISRVGNVNIGQTALRDAAGFDNVAVPEADDAPRHDDLSGRFAVSEDDTVVRNFWRGFGGGRGWFHGLRWYLLAVGVVLMLSSPARWRGAVALAPAVIAALVLYVPSICTLAVETLSATWLVGRLAFVFWITFPPIVVGSVFYWLEVSLARWTNVRLPISRFGSAVRLAPRAFGALIIVVAAMGYQQNFVDWGTYAARVGSSAEKRWHEVRYFVMVREWLEERLTPGETVLTPAPVAFQLAPLYDLRFIAPKRGAAGVFDAEKRERRLAALLAPDTDPIRRVSLLQRYGIRHMLAVDEIPDWTRPYGLRAMRHADSLLMLIEFRNPLLR